MLSLKETETNLEMLKGTVMLNQTYNLLLKAGDTTYSFFRLRQCASYVRSGYIVSFSFERLGSMYASRGLG